MLGGGAMTSVYINRARRVDGCDPCAPASRKLQFARRLATTPQSPRASTRAVPRARAGVTTPEAVPPQCDRQPAQLREMRRTPWSRPSQRGASAATRVFDAFLAAARAGDCTDVAQRL